MLERDDAYEAAIPRLGSYWGEGRTEEANAQYRRALELRPRIMLRPTI